MRRGITLLEVLIAMGIMAIGLLMILALLPLAHYNYAQAVRSDRASTLASNAMADLQIRGNPLNPLFWLDANGNSALNPADNGQTFNPALTPPPSPFIIDPLAMSHPANAAATPGYFPVSTAGLPGPPPILHRLTLRAFETGPAMSYPLAERMFVSEDDLIYNIPKNADLRTTTDDGLPANSAGDYSYLFMVSLATRPIWKVGPDGGFGVAGIDDDVNGIVDDDAEAGWPGSDDVLMSGPDNRFRVSVVVFNKRLLSPLSTVAPYSSPPAERIVLADVIGGIGGGDFTLRTPIGTTAVDAGHLLKVRPDDWLMLSAWIDDPQFGQRAVCQWYRVLGVDEGPRLLPSGEYARDVMLQGSDWSTLHRDADSAGVPTAYATLLVGCCEVHEQTVVLSAN